MKHICKLITLIVLSALTIFPLSGQDEEYLRGRFFISPEFGLIVGNITRIEVSPVLGYYLTDRLSIAGGFRYEYYKLSKYYENNYETHIYGPRIYGRYSIIKNLGEVLPVQSDIAIFAHAEFESLSLDREYFGSLTSIQEGRFWYSTMLLGGGISQTASERIKLNAVVLWDIDTSSLSPFTNPIIRIGVQIMLGKNMDDWE